MQDSGIEHAETAGRLCTADRIWIIGAVDAVKAVAEIEGHGTQRILDAARHLYGQPRVALAHLGRGMPVRPSLLAADLFRACPAETLAAHTDGVFVGAI